MTVFRTILDKHHSTREERTCNWRTANAGVTYRERLALAKLGQFIRERSRPMESRLHIKLTRAQLVLGSCERCSARPESKRLECTRSSLG